MDALTSAEVVAAGSGFSSGSCAGVDGLELTAGRSPPAARSSDAA